MKKVLLLSMASFLVLVSFVGTTIFITSWTNTNHNIEEDVEQAIADHTKAIELNPDSAEAYYSRGLAYVKSKNWEEAITDYTKAIELKPVDAEIYYSRGLAYDGLRDWEQAIADYTKAIELDANYAEAYNNRGWDYYAISDLPWVLPIHPEGKLRADDAIKQAISDFTKAIRLNPNYAEAYCRRGRAYSRWGLRKHQLSDYNKAIQVDPNYADTYIARGLYFFNTDRDQTLADYNKAIEIDPTKANYYVNRGGVYDSYPGCSQCLEKAIEDYTKAIELDPDFFSAYLRRGWAYKGTGRPEQAIKDFERYLELVPNAPNREEVMDDIEQLRTVEVVPN